MFTYKRLQRPDQQIRLLYLQPANDSNDEIRCSLSTHDIGTLPEYKAISYTWGDPNLTRPIFVNSKQLEVRENCWYVLWQMRYHDVMEPIWIDAICINQFDDREKGPQVSRMGDVYKHAKGVCVCVGPHEGDSEFFVRCAKAHSMFQQREDTKSRVPIYGVDVPCAFLPSGIMRTSVGLAGSTPLGLQRLVDAGAALLGRSYFKRLWIVQELCLAQERTLYCGPDCVGIRDTYIFHRSLDNLAFVRPVKCSLHFSSRQWLVHTGLQRPQGTNIMATMLTYGERDCFDPRDKVFGFLSLADWPCNMRIKADYTITVVELLLKVFTVVAQCQQDRKGRDALPPQLFADVRELIAMLRLEPSSKQVEDLWRARVDSSILEVNHRASNNRRSLADNTVALRLAPCGTLATYCAEDKTSSLKAPLADLNDLIPVEDSSDEGSDSILASQTPSHIAGNRLDNGLQPVRSYMGIASAVCPRAEAGDILLNFGSHLRGANGLVCRRFETESNYRIVGQAVIGERLVGCPGGVVCQCGSDEANHAPKSLSWTVHFHPEDLLLLAMQSITETTSTNQTHDRFRFEPIWNDIQVTTYLT